MDRFGLRRLTAAFALVVLCAPGFAEAPERPADDGDLKAKALALNDVTGDEPIQGQIKALAADPAGTKKLLAAAVPLAKAKEQPFNYNGAYVLARAALELKDYEAAQVFFRVCVDQAVKVRSPQKIVQGLSGLDSIIRLLYADKKYDETAKLCQEFLELLEKEGISQEVREGVLRQWIRALVKQGKADDAAKMIENLLKVRGSNWRNLELSAWFYQETGKLDDAAKAYQDLLEQVGKDKELDSVERGDNIAQIHELLSRVYARLQKPDEAKAQLRESAKTYENLIDTIANDAKLDREQKEGLRDIVRYRLSGLYVDLKDVDKAAAQLQKLLADHPDNPTYNNDLGYIWADNNLRIDEAEKLIRKALDEDRKTRRERNPDIKPDEDKDNAAYLDSLGWVLFKKKQYAEAKKYLLQAVEDPKEGQHVEIYDHLGDAHLALGEKAEALAAWKKGVEVAGESTREQEKKAEVEKKLKEMKGEP
jgi:tetratricopeptide (TPR) repeat protein